MSRNRGEQHHPGCISSPDRHSPIRAAATITDDPPSPSPASRRSVRLTELTPGRRTQEEELLRSPSTRRSAVQLPLGSRQRSASTSARRQLAEQASQHPAPSQQIVSSGSTPRLQPAQEAVRRSPRLALADRAAQQHTFESLPQQTQGERKRQRTFKGKGISLYPSCAVDSLRAQEQRPLGSRPSHASKEIKVKAKRNVKKMDRLAAVRSSSASTGSSSNATRHSSSSSDFSPFSDGSMQPSTSALGAASAAFGDPPSDPSSALLQSRMPLQEIPLWLADSRGELIRRRSPAAGWTSSTGNGSFEELASSSNQATRFASVAGEAPLSSTRRTGRATAWVPASAGIASEDGPTRTSPRQRRQANATQSPSGLAERLGITLGRSTRGPPSTSSVTVSDAAFAREIAPAEASFASNESSMPSLSYSPETSFETDAGVSPSRLRLHRMPATPTSGQQHAARVDLQAVVPAGAGGSRTRKRARSTEKSREGSQSSDDYDFDDDDPAIHDKENTPSPSPARSAGVHEAILISQSHQVLTPSGRVRYTQTGFSPSSLQRGTSASPIRPGTNLSASSPLRQSSTPSSAHSSAAEERTEAANRVTRSSPRRSRVDQIVFSLDKHIEGEGQAQPRIEGEDVEMA